MKCWVMIDLFFNIFYKLKAKVYAFIRILYLAHLRLDFLINVFKDIVSKLKDLWVVIHCNLLHFFFVVENTKIIIGF